MSEDAWMVQALAYIEKENGPARKEYLSRVSPHIARLDHALVDYRTPAGAYVQMVKRSDGYTERWRVRWNGVEASSEYGFSVSFADVSFNVSGHDWDLEADVPGVKL